MKKYVLLFCAFLIWTSSLFGQELGQQTLAQLKASPAGSNVIKFLRAINETETFTEKHIPELFASGIGTRDKPGDFIFHNGGGPGINTWMQSDVATGYSIIVLGNYSPPTASKVVRYIGKTLNLDVL